MSQKVKWLLVGPGDISHKRAAPALAQAQNSELVGVVYHTRRQQAQALAEKFGNGVVHDDFTQALASTDADAVYLATPVALHAEHAVAAMESGRHVLIEKPLGLSAANCAPIIEAADRTGLVAACAYYRRLYPRYAHAAEMLASGEFGRVVLVRVDFFGWFDPQPDDPKAWRTVRARSGGGPVADMGCHMLDVLIGLFGLPETVFARCGCLAHDWDVEDTASVLMTLAGGAQVTAAFGWNTKTWRHDFEIVGTEAKLLWEPYDTGPVVKTVGRDVTELDLPNAANVHLPLVQDFVDAVTGCGPPTCSVRDAAKTNVLMDAIYTSAAEGRDVRILP